MGTFYEALFGMRKKMMDYHLPQGLVEIRALEGRCMVTMRIVPAEEGDHFTVWFYSPQSQVARYLFIEEQLRLCDGFSTRDNLELLKQGIAVEFTKKKFVPKNQLVRLENEGYYRRQDPLSWPIVYSYNDLHIYRRFPVGADRQLLERCLQLLSIEEAIPTIASAMEEVGNGKIPIVRYNRKRHTFSFKGEEESLAKLIDEDLDSLLNVKQDAPLTLEEETKIHLVQSVTHTLPCTLEIQINLMADHFEEAYDKYPYNYSLKIADERQVVATYRMVTLEAHELQQMVSHYCHELGFFPKEWKTSGLFASFLQHSLAAFMDTYNMTLTTVGQLPILDNQPRPSKKRKTIKKLFQA